MFDEAGKFSPVYDEKKLQTLQADQVIVAIGQMVDPGIASHIGADMARGLFQG